MVTYQPRGKYFEEFITGQEVITPGRTVTETDLVNFAGLSGDFNTLHTDAEYARTTPFGERIAHGLLGLAIASGLLVQLGLLEGTVMGFRELQWKFRAPIKIGDTIHVLAQVKETKPLPRAGGGVIVLALQVVNQRGETAHQGEWTAIVMSRPKSS